MQLLTAVALAAQLLGPSPALPTDTLPRLALVTASAPADSGLPGLGEAHGPSGGGPRVAPVGLRIAPEFMQDTIRRRPRAVTYSDGYYKRVALHKALSWAMLPLFAASYFSGDQLLSKGDAAPAWAETVHPIAATSTAVLFGANTVTGTWNLWEGRKDPNGRTRRIVHSVLFMAASGGFAYAGTTLADEAEQSAEKRRDHRTMALASMGASTASWLLMLIGN